jgi:hypothetical protein
MKYIPTFEQFINEKKKELYEYGCVMLYFDFPELNKISSVIEEDDIYTVEGDRSYGIEDEPHVTLLYGLHQEVKDSEVFNIIENYNITDLKLYNISAFKNDKFDVLKFDVGYSVKGGSFLQKINKDLSALPHTTDYPDYHPHSTIAYLKKGMSDKYINMFKDIEYVINPKYTVYSKPDGTKVKKSI